MKPEEGREKRENRGENSEKRYILRKRKADFLALDIPGQCRLVSEAEVR
jgi:hypothetical protein